MDKNKSSGRKDGDGRKERSEIGIFGEGTSLF